jgi:hypothetical protein
MDFAAPHSRDQIPARARRYSSHIDGLPTPTGENDLRICPANSDPFDLPVPRSFCAGSVEFAFVAADKLYGFTHPTDAGNQRFVPLGKIRAPPSKYLLFRGTGP